MTQIILRGKTLRKQANDYAIALALVFEISVLYGGFKLAVRFGLVNSHNEKMAQAPLAHPVQERERDGK